MQISINANRCEPSPMRKFHPLAVAAQKSGKKIYHLNIGQPDIETPKAYFDAVKHFDQPVLEYAPSPGMPELIEAIRGYYAKLDMHFDPADILITNGGSEALQIVMNCILDDGDEILIPEPFYPNYNTMVCTCGAAIHPIPTCPEEGYHYADRKKIEAEINEHTRAIMCTNPGNPTGKCFSRQNIEDICKICARENIVILADEVYQENIYRPGDKFISFKKVMSELKLNCQLVSFHSTSKGYWGECGRRGGYLEMVNFPNDVRAELYKLLSICCCSNVDGQYTMDVMINPPKPGDASYELFEKEKNGILDSLKIRAKKLSTALNKLDGVSCLSVDGALYTYFRLTMPPKAIEAAKKLGKAADLMYCMDLLNEAGVVCVPGSGFGQEEGTYHVRSTILPPMNEIDQVVERMNNFHKKWMAKYQ